MRRFGSVASLLLASGLLLAGCGGDPGTTVSAGGDGDSASSSAPDTQPTLSGMTGPGQTVDGARLLYFDVLPIEPGDFPPLIPLAEKVDGVRGLATTYAGTPGIEAVVNAISSISSLTSTDSLYAFVVTPCIADDAILQVSAKVVTVKVTGSGSSAVKCEPPPVRIAVFAVPTASVPSSAVVTPASY